MEISNFNTRARAEAGAPMQIKDPISKEPIMDCEKPCQVIVRGTASISMQATMREKQKALMAKKPKKGKDEDDEVRVMEDVHQQLCEGAAPFIRGFENMERDGRPMTLDDVEWFLDLSFPEMGIKEDEHGNPVLDKDGTPVFEMKNEPFAKQIADFAGRQANFLGNAKSG